MCIYLASNSSLGPVVVLSYGPASLLRQLDLHTDWIIVPFSSKGVNHMAYLALWPQSYGVCYCLYLALWPQSYGECYCLYLALWPQSYGECYCLSNNYAIVFRHNFKLSATVSKPTEAAPSYFTLRSMEMTLLIINID